jgi:hypothetical protein
LIPTSSAVPSSDRAAERRDEFAPSKAKSLICLSFAVSELGQNSTPQAPAPYFQADGQAGVRLGRNAPVGS